MRCVPMDALALLRMSVRCLLLVSLTHEDTLQAFSKYSAAADRDIVSSRGAKVEMLMREVRYRHLSMSYST